MNTNNQENSSQNVDAKPNNKFSYSYTTKKRDITKIIEIGIQVILALFTFLLFLQTQHST